MIQTEIIKEIDRYCFADKAAAAEADAFVCLYGSSVYHPDKLTSDVDLFYAYDNSAGPAQLSTEELASFVRDFHTYYGRKIDEEVPYENKLVYTFEDLDNAVNFGGFTVLPHGINIPKIEKNSDFLGSYPVKLRLAMNALTTPNQILAYSDKAARRYRRLAELSMTLVGISLTNQETFKPEDISQSLSRSDSGDYGELFLGYKLEHSIVERHLGAFVLRSLETLADNKHLAHTDAGDYQLNSPFSPGTIMDCYTGSK